MTVKLKFTRAQMRSMAIIAKEEGVKLQLNADGSLSVAPTPVDEPDQSNQGLNTVVSL